MNKYKSEIFALAANFFIKQKIGGWVVEHKNDPYSKFNIVEYVVFKKTKEGQLFWLNQEGFYTGMGKYQNKLNDLQIKDCYIKEFSEAEILQLESYQRKPTGEIKKLQGFLSKDNGFKQNMLKFLSRKN